MDAYDAYGMLFFFPYTLLRTNNKNPRREGPAAQRRGA
jgi:hypothetical protein